MWCRIGHASRPHDTRPHTIVGSRVVCGVLVGSCVVGSLVWALVPWGLVVPNHDRALAGCVLVSNEFNSHQPRVDEVRCDVLDARLGDVAVDRAAAAARERRARVVLRVADAAVLERREDRGRDHLVVHRELRAAEQAPREQHARLAVARGLGGSVVGERRAARRREAAAAVVEERAAAGLTSGDPLAGSVKRG